MSRSQNVFAALADRAEVGESSAQRELCRKLEPEMAFIVRRVIQQGASHSAIDQRILAEARRLGLDAESVGGAEGEMLIRRVARCVSLLFVDGLRAKQAHRHMMAETVRN